MGLSRTIRCPRNSARGGSDEIQPQFNEAERARDMAENHESNCWSGAWDDAHEAKGDSYAMKPYILFFNHSEIAQHSKFADEWIVGELSVDSYVSASGIIDGDFDLLSHHVDLDDALLALEVFVKADQIKERS